MNRDVNINTCKSMSNDMVASICLVVGPKQRAPVYSWEPPKVLHKCFQPACYHAHLLCSSSSAPWHLHCLQHVKSPYSDDSSQEAHHPGQACHLPSSKPSRPLSRGKCRRSLQRPERTVLGLWLLCVFWAMREALLKAPLDTGVSFGSSLFNTGHIQSIGPSLRE